MHDKDRKDTEKAFRDRINANDKEITDIKEEHIALKEKIVNKDEEIEKLQYRVTEINSRRDKLENQLSREVD